MAQPLGVVERDVGDDGKHRLDDVGRIQASAEADFEHRDIDFFGGKLQKSHRGDGLEEAGGTGQAAFGDQFFRRVDDGFEPLAEIVVGNQGVGNLMGGIRCSRQYLHALVHAHQVRRRIEAGAQAGGAEDRSERGGGRALAVGARDEDGTELLLRIAQRSHEGAHLGQFELAPGLAGGGVQFGAQGLQAVDCLGVEHIPQFTGVS